MCKQEDYTCRTDLHPFVNLNKGVSGEESPVSVLLLSRCAEERLKLKIFGSLCSQIRFIGSASPHPQMISQHPDTFVKTFHFWLLSVCTMFYTHQDGSEQRCQRTEGQCVFRNQINLLEHADVDLLSDSESQLHSFGPLC